jgi:hypothetical protein
MRALPQALEIVFQVQKKRSNDKIARKKKAFQLTKCFFFLFSFFWTPPIFKSRNFFIFYSFSKI